MNPLQRFFGSIAVFCSIVVFAPATASAQIPEFGSLYVFGDSLADNGNIYALTKLMGMAPAVPPSDEPHRAYFGGRFSNGYVEFEYLWQRLSGQKPGSKKGLTPFLASPFTSAKAINFAHGGTGTEFFDVTPGGFWAAGLKGQIEMFRLSLPLRRPSRALYAIATGANDYRLDPYNVPMDPALVVGNIVESIETLYGLGARDVMVFDLPDLGLLPGNSGDPGPASFISGLHNMLLNDALTELEQRLPQLHLIRVHLDPLFQELMLSMEWQLPALEYYAAPGTSGCLFVNPATCPNVAPELLGTAELGFLFWDIVHPTTEAHHRLSDYLYQLLQTSYSAVSRLASAELMQ